MNIIISALALAVANPTAAPTAPAQSAAPAGHQDHQGMDHSQHKGTDQAGQAMECCKDGKAMPCCEQAMKDGKTMPCCEGKADTKPAAAVADGDHAGHAGHDH